MTSNYDPAAVKATTAQRNQLRRWRTKRGRVKLVELMAKFKPKHRHGEWNLGRPVGKEI